MFHLTAEKKPLCVRIEEHLRRSPEVRPFPQAVTRLVAACQDPNANSRTFEAIIECDPALSVQMLRLANSPLFCPVGDVKSIAHAVSLLGLRKLKSLAMSVAGAKMFSSGKTAEAQRQQLWCHSVGCAIVARGLAKYIPGVDADDAFLAGVFHDVGKLLFYDVAPDDYSGLEATFSGLSLVDNEDILMGTTHQKVGLTSAVSWRLSDNIKAAVGWHHHPEQAASCSEFAAVIGIADSLAKNWGIGSQAELLPELPSKLSHDFGLTEEQLSEMEVEARQAFGETIAVSLS
jgi:HD-like signal output (HDOD) protein